MKVLVLDAMGVIYSAGDDVKNLLCPFIAENGGTMDTSKIERLYHSASLGNMSAFEFWEAVDIDPRLEDEYLQRHKLTDGFIDFLEESRSQGYEAWCLSNDLSEWSKKLQIRFALNKYIQGFVISSDVGVRKPNRAIFEHLLSRLGTSPSDVTFVDDQQKNLDSAALLGFKTVLFNPGEHNLAGERHEVALAFDQLILLLT